MCTCSRKSKAGFLVGSLSLRGGGSSVSSIRYQVFFFTFSREVDRWLANPGIYFPRLYDDAMPVAVPPPSPSPSVYPALPTVMSPQRARNPNAKNHTFFFFCDFVSVPLGAVIWTPFIWTLMGTLNGENIPSHSRGERGFFFLRTPRSSFRETR